MVLMIGAAVPPLKGLFASPARLALLPRGLAVSAPAAGDGRAGRLAQEKDLNSAGKIIGLDGPGSTLTGKTTATAGEMEGRMSTERQVMQDYIDALVKQADFAAYFTDDVAATFEGTDQRADGRAAAEQLIRYVHEGAFDARPELKNLMTDEGKAAIEADFVGTHSGEFGGLAATGRAVRVPYSVVYDLRGDRISALRIYFPMSLLMEQISG